MKQYFHSVSLYAMILPSIGCSACFFSVGMRFHDDLDSGSEDSIDIRETANLLRQKDRDEDRSGKQEVIGRWVEGAAEASGLTNGNGSHKKEAANGEACDSGVESIANGEACNNGSNEIGSKEINLDSLD